MSSADPGSQHASTSHSATPHIAPRSRTSLYLKELPFSLVLILTTLGVAYTSVSHTPIVRYWEILTPLIAFVCIGSGWEGAPDRGGRVKLIWVQVLHWFAFLVVMNLLLLPSVQKTFTANATGLAVFGLLALGTFTAGLQVMSWQVCCLGIAMALAVPAIAWIENSALIVVVIVAVMLAIGVVVWWHWRKNAQADSG
jgi:hypothetical protein